MSKLQLCGSALRGADNFFQNWLLKNASEHQKVWNESHVVICKELFNNAINHGVLALDKRQRVSNGVEAYCEEREKRLATTPLLNDDWIDMQCELSDSNDLSIAVSDSGAGMSFANWELMQWLSIERGPGNASEYGRGLWLVQNLAKGVQYCESSNTFTVRCL